jgi:hypothetical protein
MSNAVRVDRELEVPAGSGEEADRRRERRLVWAGYVFLFGSAVHIFDHLRRGQGSVTEPLYWAGNLALVLQVVIITLVLTHHRLAPIIATAGGFGLAIGFAAAHWLPTWSPLSDSFLTNPPSPFSYFASAMEILGALAVGLAGLAILRARGYAALPPTETSASVSVS